MYSVLFMRYFIAGRRIGSTPIGPIISASVQPAKKPKLSAGVLSRPDTFATTSATQPDINKSWEHVAIDIEAVDLIPTIEAAKNKEENEKIVRESLIL